MNFEWDTEKNKANKIKHGFSFEEALHIFADPNAIEIYNQIHSQSEDRYKVIGQIQSKVFVVTVIYTENKEQLRLISARKANQKERNAYEKQKRWF